MLHGHVLVPSSVLYDGLPKLRDGVRLEEDSCLHSKWVQCLGFSLNLFLNQEKHYSNMKKTTGIAMHVLPIKL